MLHSLNSLLGSAVMERVTLLLNHVLSAEPVAMQRLKVHAGRCMQLHFDGWPTRLPPLPPTAFQVTPAGLLEWRGAEVRDPALRIGIDASNPALGLAQALTGQRPRIEVAGDAGFAADLNWLIDNLRWDVEDDLARAVGQAPAREIARIAGGIAFAIRGAVQAAGALVRRGRNGGLEDPPPYR